MKNLIKFAFVSLTCLALLLVCLDISRVLWAYWAVQHAAREAAAYAVTGQPAIEPDNGIPLEIKERPGGACTQPEGEIDVYHPHYRPFLCNPVAKAEAIKAIAWQEMDRWQALKCPQEIEVQLAGFEPAWNCNHKPGVFGVQIIGQVFETELSTTDPISKPNSMYWVTLPDYEAGKSLHMYVTSLPNHAGEQGLDINVSTFYNVPENSAELVM